MALARPMGLLEPLTTISVTLRIFRARAPWRRNKTACKTRERDNGARPGHIHGSEADKSMAAADPTS